MYCHIKDVADKDRLKTGIDKFVHWSDKWQVKLNVMLFHFITEDI